MKTSILTSDGRHNGFPDLIFWQGYFYLAFRSARSHIAQDSCIKVLRSSDAENWELLAKLELHEEDIRDPKLASIQGELFLYALKNRSLSPLPYTTVFATSKNGQTWTSWQAVSPANWVFWRPKSFDGVVWYVAADNRSGKESALFSSMDGIAWNKVSTIYAGEFNAEVELAFLASDEILCTVRVEGLEGDPKTLLGYSNYPYDIWSLTPSHITRLDGACSFSYHDRIYSVGRFEPHPLSGIRLGNLLNQKRASLFRTKIDEIVWMADFPSAGDTGYASAVVSGDTAFVVYYTSDPGNDYPWAIGQFGPTQIRLACIDLSLLELPPG